MKTLIEELNKDADNPAFDRRFAVGALQGMCIGISLTFFFLICGACIPAVWHWSSSITKPRVAYAASPFELSLAYNGVPFMALNEYAVQSLDGKIARDTLGLEMGRRWYFEQELLKGETRYTPVYLNDTSGRTVVEITNGQMKRVVVRLVNENGSPGRYGLLPLDVYEEDIKKAGK
jgi:hypothetical protein